MRVSFVIAASIGAALCAPMAHARVTFLGADVTAEHFYIDRGVSFDRAAAVVDGDSDAMMLSLGTLPRGAVGYRVDVDARSVDVRVTYDGIARFVSGTSNGLVLTSDAFDVPVILRSLRIVAHPRFRFDMTRVSRFGSNGIFFDLQGLAIREGYGFTAMFDPAASSAPEPAGWAMMIAGFGLAGTVARRRTVSARTAARAPQARPRRAPAVRTA